MAPFALATSVCVGCSEDNPLDFGGPRDCSIPEQNAYTYRLMQEAYFWSEHVPSDVDPAAYESPSELVRDVRYAELDRWSRVSDLATSDALFEEGQVIGLGFRTRRAADGRVVLGFVDPLSPAGQAGLERGDTLVGAAGLTATELDERDGWSDAFGPNEPGVRVQLDIASDQGAPRQLELVKDWYPLVTVPLANVVESDAGPVGYLFFTTFVEPSVDELTTAFEGFTDAGVRSVVIDLRYNGGGRISTARYLIDLLVGGQADGEVSYKTDYATALADANRTRTIERRDASLGQLDHVVFITTGSTASASELVINAVRPFANVSIVGSPTAGKPVGSAKFEFCDKAAYPITFRLVNARDEADYFDGFQPDCTARDDLERRLGDPEEGSMLAALARISADACPEVSDDESSELERAPDGLRLVAPGLPGAYPGLDELRGRY